MMVDRTKSIEQLEGCAWPTDPYQSYVVQESQRLRKIPISALTNENLRLLIGQRIGLEFILPMAMERLIENPLASGDLYQGDLLAAVAATSDDFWVSHAELNNLAVELSERVAQAVEELHRATSALSRRQFI